MSFDRSIISFQWDVPYFINYYFVSVPLQFCTVSFLNCTVPFFFLYSWLSCFVSLEDPNVYMLKFLKYFSLLKFQSILIRKNEDSRNNPWNPEKTCFRNYLQEICHKNNHVRQNTSVPTRRATTIDSIFVGN